jgi:hypothetical protein
MLVLGIFKERCDADDLSSESCYRAVEQKLSFRGRSRKDYGCITSRDTKVIRVMVRAYEG